MKNYAIFIINGLGLLAALYALTRGFYLSMSAFLAAVLINFDWLAEWHICKALDEPCFRAYPHRWMQLAVLVALILFVVGV